MATVTPVVTGYASLPGSQDGSLLMYTWTLTSTNTDGAPVPFAEYADRTITANGTWGGATLTLQGTNDVAATPALFLSLNAAAGGAAATASADKAFTVIEDPLWFRPNLTTPGSGASVVVSALFRRATPVRA